MDGDALDPDALQGDRPPARRSTSSAASWSALAASPITGLVRGLGSMVSGLAIALGQIAEQGLVTGEAPAEAEEAPAEEEPAAEEHRPRRAAAEEHRRGSPARSAAEEAERRAA